MAFLLFESEGSICGTAVEGDVYFEWIDPETSVGILSLITELAQQSAENVRNLAWGDEGGKICSLTILSTKAPNEGKVIVAGKREDKVVFITNDPGNLKIELKK